MERVSSTFSPTHRELEHVAKDLPFSGGALLLQQLRDLAERVEMDTTHLCSLRDFLFDAYRARSSSNWHAALLKC